MAEQWALLVRRGGQALLEGRFSECARLAAEASSLAPEELGPKLLVVSACREQGRSAEAEALAREAVSAHPGAAEARALLGAVLADLGRDTEAGRQLDHLDGGSWPVAVAAASAEAVWTLGRADLAEGLYGLLAARGGEFLPTGGAVARHVGLLGHVLGRWDDAAAHFDTALRANHAAGAPVPLAHTCRQYSALLRARGEDGDWERAIDLLAQAATVYRRLEIDRLAEEVEAVLRRSQELDGAGDPAGPVNVFRPAPGGWELCFGGEHAVVAANPGLGHVATLIAAAGRPVHVVDLTVGTAGTTTALVDQMRAEYRSRLAGLDAQLRPPAADAAEAAELRPPAADAAGFVDPVAAALARAERDAVLTELAALDAGAPAPDEVGDRARRLVSLRIRAALDALDDTLPALARHLRRSVRTGTFCLYDPGRPERWSVGA